MLALAFVVACGGDDVNDAADAAGDAAASARDSAHDMMNHAQDAADSMADSARDAAANARDAAASAAGGMAGDAVAACRRFAEAEAWGSALEVCKKAHEMMPDDLALEHAYQQAAAAAAH